MRDASDLRGTEHFIAREPGPEVERHWSASTRALAIEFARQARLRSRDDLAVDDATLERVADAIMDPANPPPWLALTAEERADELPPGLWDAVHGYLIDHPDVDGSVDLAGRHGRATFIVGIVGDVQPHRAALTAIGGDRVIVEPWGGRPPYTDDELGYVADRVDADAVEVALAGWHVVDVLPAVRGGLDVFVVGVPGARAATEFFASRYGAAVTARWLGPHRYFERLRPFASWAAEDCRLRVYFGLARHGEQPGAIRVAEQDDARVVVALNSLESVAVLQPAIGGFEGRHADVELRDPVGDRDVIDASTGVPRAHTDEAWHWYLGDRRRRR